MLAGLLQAPSRLAPTNNPDLAERRMRLVLRAMVDVGYLSQPEADALPTRGSMCAPRTTCRPGRTSPTGRCPRRAG
jgi:penicillin-binding protein 1A